MGTPKQVRVTTAIYPSGVTYFEAWIGNQRIGSFAREGDGYVVWNTRTILPCVDAVVRSILKRRVAAAKREIREFLAAMELPVNVDAVDTIATNPGTPTTRDV